MTKFYTGPETTYNASLTRVIDFYGVQVKTINLYKWEFKIIDLDKFLCRSYSTLYYVCRKKRTKIINTIGTMNNTDDGGF